MSKLGYWGLFAVVIIVLSIGVALLYGYRGVAG
jgi:hypothetical protein